MPSLRPRIRLPLLLATLSACLGGAQAAAPTRTQAQSGAHLPATPARAARASLAQGGSYTFDAASSEVDYKAHTGRFTHITLSQGRITVLADQAHATGLGRPNGQWTLQGDVRIHAPPHGNLTSQQAVVEVANNHITQVTVTGSPAQFTQTGMIPGKVAEGHADQIVYDIRAGTVQLVQDAWLSDGRNQISGPLVRYNILKDRIEATSGGAGERVHVTIAPQTPQTHGAQPPASPRPPGRSS